MVLKICYNHHIHRVSKLPTTFEELMTTVHRLFENQLPSEWTLQYLDAEGDTIMLSDDHDFKNLLEELSSKSKATKIFIVSLNDLQQSQSRFNASINESISNTNDTEVIQRSDDFQVIEKQEIVLPEEKEPVPEQAVLPKEEIPEEELNIPQEAEKVTQSPVMKPLVEEILDEIVLRSEEIPTQTEIVDHKSEHVQTNSQDEIDSDRCRGRRHHQRRHLKKLIKKLTRNDLSPERKDKLETKLNQIMTVLSPENREKVEEKKKKYMEKRAEKELRNKEKFEKAVTDILYQNIPALASLTKDLIQEEQPQKVEEPKREEKPQIIDVGTEVKPEEVEEKVVHEYVSCDGCEMYPLVGIRYKCYTCPDFDYCEACEAKNEHPHAFIKIRTPKQDVRHCPRFDRPHPWGRGPNNGMPMFAHCPPMRRCHMGERREGCEKWDAIRKGIEEFKGTDSFKNVIGCLFGAPLAENGQDKEKIVKDVSNLYESFPKDIQDKMMDRYKNMPEHCRNHFNNMLQGLPQQILEKKEREEAQVERKQEEVIIKEEPIPDNFIPVADNNEPLIQEIEVEIKIEEPKEEEKVYPEDVKKKAILLKEIFCDARIEDLCEYVVSHPLMEIEELVESYLML